MPQNDEVKWNGKRRNPALSSVLKDLYSTWLMKQMGLTGVVRLLAENHLWRERSTWRKQHGKSSKRYADHYAGLITENTAQLGMLHYNESKTTVKKCVEK